MNFDFVSKRLTNFTETKRATPCTRWVSPSADRTARGCYAALAGWLGLYFLKDTIRYKLFVGGTRPVRKRENVPPADLPAETAETHTLLLVPLVLLLLWQRIWLLWGRRWVLWDRIWLLGAGIRLSGR